uniref:Uncharacterized protein n=1 Tax=Sphaerodactylus townsendi TaxID=933632 RepID=A0ACB8EPG8_9SAUR
MCPSRITLLFLSTPCVIECVQLTLYHPLSSGGCGGVPPLIEKLELLLWLQFMFTGVPLRSKMLFLNGPFANPEIDVSELLVYSYGKMHASQVRMCITVPQGSYFILRSDWGAILLSKNPNI